MADKVLIMRGFEYDPYDLAVAFNKVSKEEFGQDPFFGIKPGFFYKRNPVSFSTIKVGLNQEEKIAVGGMKIKGVDGDFVVDGSSVQVYVNKNETIKVESFLDKIKAR